MDPGIDDALALYVALGSLPVSGVAAVAGNVELEKTYENARLLLEAAHRNDITVARGSSRPLVRRLVTAPHVHGTSGLDGWVKPTLQGYSGPTDPPWLSWPLLWRDEVSLIATGPLTNVAKLLWCLPEDRAGNLKGITVMGGAIHGGNVTPTAEFNFYVDPDAADWVLGGPVPVRLVGLDVTHRARMPWDAVERLGQLGSLGRILQDTLTWYGNHIERNPEGLAVHDAVAVAAYARPDLFRFESQKLQVLTAGDGRGTVVRLPESADRPAVQVAMDVDQEALLEWLWQRLVRLQEKFNQSP